MTNGNRKRPSVGLALGSGGLRGLAHVGVLKILEEEKIPIDFIAGCSIGSLIGALYACGISPHMLHRLALNMERRHWIDFTIPEMGLVAGDRTLEVLRLLTRQRNFDELNIPFATVATDLAAGQEKIFTTGEVAQAVRASISVPGIFVPYQLDDNLYVDGVLVNPIPANAVRNLGAEIVIGVDLSTRPAAPITNLFDVVLQSLNIMQSHMVAYNHSACDILLQPAVGQFSPSSFKHIDECVAAGEEAARQAVEQIFEKINS